MPYSPQIPPPRSLNIYRLVVARHLKQCDVAGIFGVSQPRIAQIVRRVRSWVSAAIGDWLFPGRDDLRFYVALQSEQIRVQEHDEDPHTVQFTAPSWSYSRRCDASIPTRSVSEGTLQARSISEGSLPTRSTRDGSSDAHSCPAQVAANISAEPINSPATPVAGQIAATSNSQADSDSPYVHDLGLIIAQMLTHWKKSRSLTSAFKQSAR